MKPTLYMETTGIPAVKTAGEITDLLADAYTAATEMIRLRQGGLRALAARLLDAGEVDGPEAEALLRRHGTDTGPVAPNPRVAPGQISGPAS